MKNCWVEKILTYLTGASEIKKLKPMSQVLISEKEVKKGKNSTKELLRPRK